MAMNFDSTWVQSVRTLLQQGHFAEAVAHTGRALRSPGNDTNGRLVQLHGLTLYVHGEHEAARDALESALLLSPLTAESLLALADLYIKNSQQKDACVSLNILVEDIDTVPTELLPRIAGLLGKVGEIRKALFVCYRVVDNDPDCDEAIFAAAQKKSDAETLFVLGDLAVEDYPTTMLGHYFNGLGYEITGNVKKALKNYERAYTLDPIDFVTKELILNKIENLK